MNPYEQLKRSSNILYKYLNTHFNFKVPLIRRVIKILVPIKNNTIPINKDYKYILVCFPKQLNYLITNRKDSLLEVEVKKIVKKMKCLTQ
jgi:hypothetical protein